MNWLSAFGGVVHYEFRMQARRRSVWIVLLGLGLLTLVVERAALRHTTPHEAGVLWALGVNVLLPLAFGILLADRLPRDERLRINALFVGLPISESLRLLGKYLGATLATMAPILLVYLAGIAVLFATWPDASLVPLTIAAFLTINLPGLFFVAAFSLACPLFMPVPVYQALFTGYWFWGNLLSPTAFGIPTLSDTLLTPIGEQRAGYFFGVGTSGSTALDLRLGAASIGALALSAAVALAVAWGYLRWQRERA